MRPVCAFIAAVIATVLALAPFGGAAAGADASASEVVAAEWRDQEIVFSYQDFTTQFSCAGLQGKVRRILAELGARDDAAVTMYGCGASFFEPSPASGLKLRFATLHPLSADSTATPVRARWREAELSPRNPRFLERADCGLVERVRDQVLPAFAHEMLEDRTRCIPHRLDGTGYYVRFKLLRAVSR